MLCSEIRLPDSSRKYEVEDVDEPWLPRRRHLREARPWTLLLLEFVAQ